MGKMENPLLVYYNQPERFAQLLNGWLFQGRPFLEAGDVKEADRRMEEKGGRRKEYRGRSRDLFKRLDNAVVRLYVGAEPMEYVDYAMPLRVMDSDMLSYVHQKKAISKENMKRRDLKQDEYLSRFSKQDRLLPVITLVLYCGEKPWDGARCLHEMLELSGLPEELKASKAGGILTKVVTGANALLQGTAMLTLAADTAEIQGGLILRDGQVEVNCAFETQLRLLRESLAGQVAKILFG